MKKILPIAIIMLFMAAPAYAYEKTGTLSTGVAPALTTSLPARGVTSITIKWKGVASAGGYNLYRINGGNAAEVFVASTTSTTYTDTNLSDGTYSYQIESYLGTLTSEKSKPTALVTIDTTVTTNTNSSSSWNTSSGNTSSNSSSGGTIVTTPTTPLAGDTNNDGVVNILDFNTLITHWGQHVTGGAADGDFNGDDVVNILDFNILITHWTK